MVQISGKYVQTQSVNFVEDLISKGVPEDVAKRMNSEKNLEIKLDGNKVTVVTDNRTRNYELDKEVSETGRNNEQYQSTVSLSGSTLTFVSKFSNGNSFTRDYVFSDTGVEIITGNSKRIFKRV